MKGKGCHVVCTVAGDDPTPSMHQYLGSPPRRVECSLLWRGAISCSLTQLRRGPKKKNETTGRFGARPAHSWSRRHSQRKHHVALISDVGNIQQIFYFASHGKKKITKTTPRISAVNLLPLNWDFCQQTFSQAVEGSFHPPNQNKTPPLSYFQLQAYLLSALFMCATAVMQHTQPGLILAGFFLFCFFIVNQQTVGKMFWRRANFTLLSSDMRGCVRELQIKMCFILTRYCSDTKVCWLRHHFRHV